MMGDNDVTLAEQLESATDINACFCVACGQPDDLTLHDPARCPGQGGELDGVTVAGALAIFDKSCELVPELGDYARALHCAIVAATFRKASPDEGGAA